METKTHACFESQSTDKRVYQVHNYVLSEIPKAEGNYCSNSLPYSYQRRIYILKEMLSYLEKIRKLDLVFERLTRHGNYSMVFYL